jgi:adenylosuccinate synthase
MVVDPEVLLSEVDSLAKRGRAGVEKRLSVSDRAHLILPYHGLIDALRENSAAEGKAIGTTKKGIGPAYEDKARRTGIRTGMLRDFTALAGWLEQAIAAWAPSITALGGEIPNVAQIIETLKPMAERIVPLLCNTSKLVDDAIRAKRHVLLEGAQGTLLDIDHGTYPFVTSSSPVAGGAPTGVGIGPNRINTVIGITKAYTTRVGGGPFATELLDDNGRHLAQVGAEFGSVTGRARRTGWLDLPALKYAARVNGIDALALTKLDVLTGLDKVQVCVAYDTAHGRTEEFPIDELGHPATRPVYKTMQGWKEPLSNILVVDQLPAAVREYVRFIEESLGVPMYLLSVGPRRGETIVLNNPFTGRAGTP